MAQKTEGLAQPPSNLPTGDDEFAKATMQAAMQRALEKAGKRSVADIPTVEAPPPLATVEATPPAPPVIETVAPASPELPPDVEIEAEVIAVRKAYLDLAADIRSYHTASIERLDPQRDLPTEWGAAYATFNNVQIFAKDYLKEKDPTKKAQILKKIELNADEGLWQRIYDNVSTALEKLQAEPIPEAPAPVAQPIEIPPTEPRKEKSPSVADMSPSAAPAAPPPEVAPPAIAEKKPSAALAKHEKKKKRAPGKEEMAS